MMRKLEKLIAAYADKFQGKPLVVTSPGRINLLGEHLDYNSGTVLPAAINRYIYLAIGARQDDVINVCALDFNDEISASLSDLKPAWKLWPNYVLGVIKEFQRMGKELSGMNIVISGDIPLAGGMSSSAALGCAAAFAINELYQSNFTKVELAGIAQKSENDFVGVKCGIMDQYASLFGKENHFIKLDCDSLQHEYVPFQSEKLEFVLFDSGVKHHLISSEYNTRREECQQGLQVIKAKLSNVAKFTDLDEKDLLQFKGQLSEKVYNRCLYVVQEIKRVELACSSLIAGDFGKLGALMSLTHEGLRDLYEVSCKECDYLVELVNKSEGVLGARMMGAGFGGCVIALVEKDTSETVITQTKLAYKQQYGKEPKVYHTAISGGSAIAEMVLA